MHLFSLLTLSTVIKSSLIKDQLQVATEINYLNETIQKMPNPSKYACFWSVIKWEKQDFVFKR